MKTFTFCAFISDYEIILINDNSSDLTLETIKELCESSEKVIGINLSDTLCGTKIFKRSRIDSIYNWQKKLFISDPFCDFDLIFSSAYSGANILEYPVHYRSRKYGKTNISRFRDGWKLILYLFNSLILFKSSRN